MYYSGFRWLSILAAAVLLATVGGCDRETPPEGPFGAKVNGTSITIEQIRVAAQPDGAPDGKIAKEAGARALEQLINQQLLVQQAEQNKLAQDPVTARALQRAREGVLASAWIDKVVGAAKPDDAQIAKYYDDNPALFAQRRVYRLLQLAVPGDDALNAKLNQQIKELDHGNDRNTLMQRLAGWLQSQGIQFRPNSVVQAAEQLPIELAPRFAQMQAGDWLLLKTPGGYQVLQVAALQEQPMTREQARSFIEKVLTARARTQATENEIKRLRAAAKIEYFGEYQGAKAANAGPAQESLPGTGAEPAKSDAAPAPEQPRSEKP